MNSISALDFIDDLLVTNCSSQTLCPCHEQRSQAITEIIIGSQMVWAGGFMQDFMNSGYMLLQGFE